MSCNSCAKPFTLLRKEKGCPSCGFSYCAKCLDYKLFVLKVNSEVKVCGKCKRAADSNETSKIVPPDVYYKRLGLVNNNSTDNTVDTSKNFVTMGTKNQKDQEILDRLRKLKEDSKIATTGSSEEEIAKRLQKIKGDVPSTSDAELQTRLARLRGVPVSTVQSVPVLPVLDLRTEQEQADDLMKQYMEQMKIDGKYKDEFNGLVNDIEARLGKLKGPRGSSDEASISTSKTSTNKPREDSVESEDEEESVTKILKKIQAEASTGDTDFPPQTNDELPFCEICNEDAQMRCLGCRYLFCKRCFLEHKDDDDGCNRYEPYRL